MASWEANFANESLVRNNITTIIIIELCNYLCRRKMYVTACGPVSAMHFFLHYVLKFWYQRILRFDANERFLGKF